MPLYYRLHHDRVSDEAFIRDARTWFWTDRGNGMEGVEVHGVYSAVRSVRDLITYIHEMQATDDTFVVAVFEGEEPPAVRVDADGSGEADWEVRSLIQEPHRGEVWVRPLRVVRWLTVSEALRKAKEGDDDA